MKYTTSAADICLQEKIMIIYDIPGYRNVAITHILIDYNGTVAVDGTLIAGVSESLIELSQHVHVHIITADTFGTARRNLRDVPCTLKILTHGDQTEQKQAYLHELGADITACIGNGRNDCLMLRDSVLGIALIQKEGAAVSTLQAADIAMGSITDALELFTNPLRLTATLRS